jgi:hypothetical protein
LEIDIPPIGNRENPQMGALNQIRRRAKKLLLSKVSKQAKIGLFIEFDRWGLSPISFDRALISTIANFGGSVEMYAG